MSDKKDILYKELVRLAKARELAAYSEIGPLAGLNMEDPRDRKVIGGLLREIAQAEHEADRPMLTALVVRRGHDPGPGFYQVAQEFGLFEHPEDYDLKNAFWEEQVQAVYDCWKDR